MKKSRTTTKGKNILLVDNDKSLAHDLTDYVEREDIDLNFIVAESCGEALEQLDHEKIDLIVLEIILPLVSGYGLLNALKKDRKKIPVIIYTRLKSPQDLATMASYNVDNIFLKPLLKMEELVKVIVGHEGKKAELDKILLELQNQAQSLSDSEIQSELKVVQCPRCHMILSPESHFCNNCGQKIFKTNETLLAKSPGEAAESEKAVTPQNP